MSPSRALHTAIDDCTRIVRKLREQNTELLGALESLVSVIDALGVQGGERMERARNAIKKAKGGQS